MLQNNKSKLLFNAQSFFSNILSVNSKKNKSSIMFANFHQLNEGKSIKCTLEKTKKLLNEGENPRTYLPYDNSDNYQKSRTLTHVNSKWEKFRK